MRTVADGQVASSATAIYTAPKDGMLVVALSNTSGSTTETVVVTLLRTGSTARRVARFVMAPNEQAIIQGIGVAADDIVKATTTNASTVDYTVSYTTADLTFDVRTLDANGQAKGLATAATAYSLGVMGASTAGAGTTTTDAGVLPAATAAVYPTSAADDTVGVRIHADDKVTGRLLFIGNNVSNKILKVYAPTGGTINGASANAAFSSVSGKGVVMYCSSAGSNTWLAW